MLYFPFSPALLSSTADLLIPKPKGQVGCLSRGGYNLKSALNDWKEGQYVEVQVWLQAE